MVSGNRAWCCCCLTVRWSGSAKYEFVEADWLAPASELPTWYLAVQRHEAEARALRACMSGEGPCDRLQKSVGHILTKAAQLPEERRIRLINAYVNKRRYKFDRRKEHAHSLSDNPRLRNHWSTLMDFMRRGGDCEDYASAKYFLLRELGIPAADLRVLVTYDRRLRDHHAVLALHRRHLEPGKRVLLLDSDRIHRGIARGQRFIYAVNEYGIWDHDAARGR